MSQARPHILLSNDDGIEAPGLTELARALRPHADLTIVAPAGERSGMSHAITVFKAMELHEHLDGNEFFGWGLEGSPADCVKVALQALELTRPVDLVLAGINQGQNCGCDAAYSGTIAAAREGAILGYPSAAISLFFRDPKVLPFATAAQVAVDLLPRLLEIKMPAGGFLNINVPPVPYGELRGTRVTRQGNARYEDLFKSEGPNERIEASYMNIGKSFQGTTLEGDDYDDQAVAENYVSITPMQVDVTAHGWMAVIRSALENA